MLEFLLIRTGVTEYDRQGRIQGTLDLPLCETAAEELAAIVQQLKEQKIDTLYCAACQAAQQTGEIFAQSWSVRCKPLDALTNVDHGLWQGLRLDELRQKHPKVFRQWQENPDSICPPGGEEMGDVRDRVESVLRKLLKKHRQGRIALVLPDPLFSIVRCYLKQEELANLWENEDRPHWELIPVTSSIAAISQS